MRESRQSERSKVDQTIAKAKGESKNLRSSTCTTHEGMSQRDNRMMRQQEQTYNTGREELCKKLKNEQEDN